VREAGLTRRRGELRGEWPVDATAFIRVHPVSLTWGSHPEGLAQRPGERREEEAHAEARRTQRGMAGRRQSVHPRSSCLFNGEEPPGGPRADAQSSQREKRRGSRGGAKNSEGNGWSTPQRSSAFILSLQRGGAARRTSRKGAELAEKSGTRVRGTADARKAVAAGSGRSLLGMGIPLVSLPPRPPRSPREKPREEPRPAGVYPRSPVFILSQFLPVVTNTPAARTPRSPLPPAAPLGLPTGSTGRAPR